MRKDIKPYILCIIIYSVEGFGLAGLKMRGVGVTSNQVRERTEQEKRV